MNTNVDFEEHTVDKEKRQKKIESKKRDKVKSTGRKKMHSPKDNRNSAFRNKKKYVMHQEVVVQKEELL